MKDAVEITIRMLFKTDNTLGKERIDPDIAVQSVRIAACRRLLESRRHDIDG